MIGRYFSDIDLPLYMVALKTKKKKRREKNCLLPTASAKLGEARLRFSEWPVVQRAENCCTTVPVGTIR